MGIDYRRRTEESGVRTWQMDRLKTYCLHLLTMSGVEGIKIKRSSRFATQCTGDCITSAV